MRLKLNRNSPCFFKKTFTLPDGREYSTSELSNLNSRELKEGKFYVKNLKIGINIKSNSCLFTVVNGILCIHKSSSWNDNYDDNDLNYNNYEKFEINPEEEDLICFFEIKLEGYVSRENVYYDDINCWN